MGRLGTGKSAASCLIDLCPLNRDAIDELTHLEAQATPYPWTAQSLADSYNASAECYWIRRQGESIGYCVVQSVLDEAELLNIVVFKPFQLRGFGAVVITKIKEKLAESGIKALFLEVRASNAVARSLYEKTGFEVINIRRNYYRTENREAEEALLMRCLLE